MRVLSGLFILAVVAAVKALPAEPTVVEALEPVDGFPIQVDTFPEGEDDQQVSDGDAQEPVGGETDVGLPDESGAGEGEIDDVSKTIFKDLERRILNDMRNFQRDLLMIRRLLGESSPRPSDPNTDSFWSIFSGSDDSPFNNPDFPFLDSDPGFNNPDFPFHESDAGFNDPDFPFTDGGDSYDYDYKGQEGDSDNGDGSFFNVGFGRPFFNFKPIFPDFQIPNVPDLDDLPDNYHNSTHEVHVVNGTRVEVNQTINKEADDGFRSVFHHQVFNFGPHGDEADQTPEEVPEFPEREVEPTSEQPNLPDVENEGEIPFLNEVVPAEFSEDTEVSFQ